MADRMFGLECEYALSALGPRGGRVDQGLALEQFMEAAKEILACLPDRSATGVFLGNGSRLYLDCGGHPELATPEVLTPWDFVRYSAAGDRIMAAVADRMRQRDRRLGRVFVSRCNVGYSRNLPTTWGCHESHGHRMARAALPEAIVPHLVSRIVYTGAGGFDNRAPGIEFMISPRVAHLVETISCDSTGSRGIFHTKDESLSQHGHHRLHILCGESLCSHEAQWLRGGITALVLALAEAGLRPCHALKLMDPLEAMRAFAADTSLAHGAPSVDGRHWTALAMQRHILDQIEAHLEHPVMPAWASQACQRLRQVLDRLERGAAAAARSLDWAIKLSLYREVARREGIAWESLPAWNRVLREIRDVLRAQGEAHARLPISRALLAFNNELAGQVDRWGAILHESGLNWDGLDAVLQLRAKLCDLDTRFSQLGPEGIFDTLDRAGALDHAAPGVDDIEQAVDHPPSAGRARLRGEYVQRFHREPGEYRCDWMGVWDVDRHRYLDLSDPFATQERWENYGPQDSLFELFASTPHYDREAYTRAANDAMMHARTLYDQGYFEEAQRALCDLWSMPYGLTDDIRRESARIRAWVQTRRGYLDGSELLAGIARRYDPLPLWLIADFAFVHRFSGLAPREELAVWVGRGEETIARHSQTPLGQGPAPAADTVAVMREHRGAALMAAGQIAEAIDALREACDGLRRVDGNARILCRALVTLAEAHRRHGQRREAVVLLDEAMSLQRAQGFHGDLADFSLACQAKLQSDADRARASLEEAQAIQATVDSRMGRVRTMLLEARLAPDPARAQRIRRRLLDHQRHLPALGQCKLLQKILDNWRSWTAADRAPDESGDAFWGL